MNEIMRKRLDKNFRISKQTKRMMATITDDNQRHSFKWAMIEAQLKALETKNTKQERE